MTLKDPKLIKYMRGSLYGVKAIVEFINSSECTKDMINSYDEYTLSPLCSVCKYLQLEVVDALIKKGADVNQIQPQCEEVNSNPLNFCLDAIAFDETNKIKKIKIIELLINAGANLKTDAFFVACKNNSNESIKKLLEYSVNLYYVDQSGKTGMDYLKYYHKKNVVDNQEIIQLIENVMLKDELENTLENKTSNSLKSKI